MPDRADLWLGVPLEKRSKLMESGLALLASIRPHVKSVERWVGKMSFTQGFKASTRSTFESIYSWIDGHRRAGRKAGMLWPSVVAEIFVSIVELPCMRVNMA